MRSIQGITSSNLEQSDALTNAFAIIKTDYSEDKPNVTMCRNFARAACKKGAACIFTHDIILTQLRGFTLFVEISKTHCALFLSASY